MLPIVFRRILICLLLLPAVLSGQTPELSADSPISFDADEGMLLAEGEAVYRDGNVLVQAEEIRYYRSTGRVEATGNVRVTRAAIRLVTEKLTYDAKTKIFTSGRFRAGYPPLFVEGKSFSGTLDEIQFAQVTAHYREPMPGTPRLRVASGSWKAEDRLSISDVSLQFPFGGFGLPLPDLDRSISAPPFEFYGEAGYRNHLGLYARTETLFPLTPDFGLGANFDLYSKRGLLFGPVLELNAREEAYADWNLRLDSGWIQDQDEDERGFDRVGDAVGESRGFLSLEYLRHHEGADFRLQGTWQSDSEVFRDFRPDRYFQNPQASLEAEMNWVSSANSLLSLYAGFQETDGFGQVERLPQLNWELLPRPLGESGIYLQAKGQATQYRELADGLGPLPGSSFWGLGDGNPFSPTPVGERSDYIQRVDLGASLSRPITLLRGLSLTPRTGFRWIHAGGDPVKSVAGRHTDRLLTEVGADLSFRAWADYPNGFTGSGGLGFRHLMKAFLSWRWFPSVEHEDMATGWDQPVASPYAPVMNLHDIRVIDAPLADLNILRFGVENSFLRLKDQRPVGRFAIYSDYLPARGGQRAGWDDTYLETRWMPTPWLDLHYLHRFDTESLRSRAIRLGIGLRSGDVWNGRIYGEFLDQAIEEYGVEGVYRFAESWAATMEIRYDVLQDRFPEQRYGLRKRIGQTWEWEVYVRLTEGNAREDDFGLGMRITLLRF